jgi:hypothetical protein
MNMRTVLLTLLPSLLICSAAHGADASACTALRISLEKGNETAGAIVRPGRYCLRRDTKQITFYGGELFYEARVAAAVALIYIRDTSDVHIDLMGHTMETTSRGAVTLVENDPSGAQSGGIDYTIRNGRLLATRFASHAIALMPFAGYDINDKRRKGLPLPPYPVTNYVVEQMEIRGSGRGVKLIGANNRLKRNVIEVHEGTAVEIDGPGAIVEDNTFIVHLGPRHDRTAKSGPKDIEVPFEGILRLRDGDGAVIRNNRFIVKSNWLSRKHAPFAVKLVNSKGVTLEGNTLEHVGELVVGDEHSSHEVR